MPLFLFHLPVYLPSPDSCRCSSVVGISLSCLVDGPVGLREVNGFPRVTEQTGEVSRMSAYASWLQLDVLIYFYFFYTSFIEI